MEILFENPLIVIILIGVISSLFKNRDKSEKQESPAKRVEADRHKPTQKSGDVFQEMREIFKETSRTFQEEIKPERQFSEKQSEKKIAEVKVVLEEELPSLSEKPDKQHAPQTIQQQQLKEFKVDESKLAEAVIWAEILGPPRAKKPYSHNRSRAK
ncbi:hypothetical protein R4Z10_16025 [Niallia sp. XMNu-256]|uniref:hypothetical protein n=1 Tax=Niallia sp. XMNu-256 TaxID=3082444 RepID=UPI0030CF0F20